MNLLISESIEAISGGIKKSASKLSKALLMFILGGPF